MTSKIKGMLWLLMLLNLKMSMQIWASTSYVDFDPNIVLNRTSIHIEQTLITYE